MSLLKANYFDHPDGTDASGKMIATNKYAIGTGLAWSTVDVLMLSKPQGYASTLARYAYFTGPLIGMATAFTMVTYFATNVRGKDDKLNYFLGGMAAGGVLGSWRRSAFAGFGFGVIFGVAGMVKKLSKEEGWEFFPKVKHQVGSLNIASHDFTLMKDRPRNWTTEK